MLKFNLVNGRFGTVKVAVSDTTGFTYEIHNKWNSLRGEGYAVFVRDCSTGKSVTGNKAAFHSKSLQDCDAVSFCDDHNDSMNKA